MDKKSMVKKNSALLDSLGFAQVDVTETHSCFDIMAERNGRIVLLKIVKNIDSVNGQSIEALKKLSKFLEADTFIIGSMHKGEKLSDTSSLYRRGLPCISGGALEYTLTGGEMLAKSDRFKGAKYRIDGAALRRMRKLCGMSMKQLAEAVGVSKDSIYRYERGEAYATSEYMLRLESFFKSKLWYSDGPRPIENKGSASEYKRLNDKLDVLFMDSGGAPFEMLGKRAYRYEIGRYADARTLNKLSSLYKGIAELLEHDYPFFISTNGRHRSVNGIAILTNDELGAVQNEDELITIISSRS